LTWRLLPGEIAHGSKAEAELQPLFIARASPLPLAEGTVVSAKVAALRFWPHAAIVKGVPRTRVLLIPRAHRQVAIVVLVAAVLLFVGAIGYWTSALAW